LTDYVLIATDQDNYEVVLSNSYC